VRGKIMLRVLISGPKGNGKQKQVFFRGILESRFFAVHTGGLSLGKEEHFPDKTDSPDERHHHDKAKDDLRQIVGEVHSYLPPA
jgi:hypothetical protein